jgi:Gpi18-like mannosyltransferase
MNGRLQMTINRNTVNKTLVYALFFLGITIRFFLLPIESLDMKNYLLPWYDYIVSHGIWISLGDEFSNYTPSYLYLLALATLSHGFISKITAIKLISILFDFFNIYLIYHIVKFKTKDNELSLLSAALFFCLPTIILNSSTWGQADPIFTSFILISLLYLLRGSPLLAIISFGIAIAFKAQAVFFTPFLLLLTIKKRIPLSYYLLLPITYLIMMTPALLAGRSLLSVLSVYLGQADTFKSLSMKAPNLYLFMPDELYTPLMYIGIITTVVVTLLWAAGYAIKIKEFNSEIMLICATVSVSMIPFLLPKMHERYFYLMDVFTFLLAFYIQRLWFPAIGAQVVSGLTYYVFIFISSQQPPPSIGAVFLISAAFINTFLIGYLFWKQYNFINHYNRLS